EAPGTAGRGGRGMSMDCEMLGALLSERRRGELSPEEARAPDGPMSGCARWESRALYAQRWGCARCRTEASGIDAVLAAVELPPVSIAELEALRSRRIGEGGPRESPTRRLEAPPARV